MSEVFIFKNNVYEIKSFSKNGKNIIQQIHFVDARIIEILNEKAMLNKAKNGYIEDLKKDYDKNKTNINYSDFIIDF